MYSIRNIQQVNEVVKESISPTKQFQWFSWVRAFLLPYFFASKGGSRAAASSIKVVLAGRKMALSFLLFPILLVSCHSSDKGSTSASKESGNKYAELFSLVQRDHFVELNILSPTDRSLVKKYILVRKEFRSEITSADPIIEIPVKNIACLSATHIGFLSVLDGLDRISALENFSFVDDFTVKEKIKRGTVAELGSIMNLNPEAVFKSQSQLVTYGGMMQDLPIEQKISKLGIALLPSYEWSENHPLAKAEWVKVFAALLDQAPAGNSYFDRIEKNYLTLSQLAQEKSQKELVLTGNLYGDTWYVPQKDNYSTKLFTDAGYRVVGEEYPGNLSESLSLEVVLKKYAQAPYWFNVNAKSRKDLKVMNARYAYFEAFKNKKCYTFTNVNHYWEYASVEPDVILGDLIQIANPELNVKAHITYYQPLK